MTYTSAQENTIKVIVATTSVFSIIGSLCIIASYVAWSDIRVTSRKLLCFLSFCDLVTAIFNMIGVLAGPDELHDLDGTPTSLCVIQSFFNSASSIASFLWTVAIGLFLYLTIVQGNVQRAEQSVVFMHVVCWVVPFVCISVALGCDVLGYDESITGGWCWLKDNISNRMFWLLFAGKGWELASYVVTPVLYLLTKLRMGHERGLTAEKQSLLTQSARDAVQEADRKLVAVPIIFVLLRLWGTLRFFFNHVLDLDDIFAIDVLQAFGDSSQGFANAILFCVFTRRVRLHFVQLFRREVDRDGILQSQ